MEKNKKVKMSPAARKLAREMGINVGEIEGSSSVIRSKDLIDHREAQFVEELIEDVALAAKNTKNILSVRYGDILAEEKRTQSYLSWKEAKDSQTEFADKWVISRQLERVQEERALRQAVAGKIWAREKDIQTRKRIGYYMSLNDEKREKRQALAKKAWNEAKCAQTAAKVEYLVKVNEAKRAAKAKLAKAEWAELKASQDNARVSYFVKLTNEKRAERAKTAKAAWCAQKDAQNIARRQYLAKLTEEKRVVAENVAYKAWVAAKEAQTAQRRAYLLKVTEEKRAQRANCAYKSWQAAKALMDKQQKDYMQAVEDAKINAAYLERVSLAKVAWEELKAEGDSKIEEFMDMYDTRIFEEAYDEYISSLDEYNQVSVGKIEFEIEDIEEDIEDEEIPLNEAVTKYVAQATAKALIDLECPIYENGLMNVVSLTGAKPIRTVRNAENGEYLDIVFEDAVYFSKDIKVRVWDLSACGLESFFASQGGINVYINLEDDEVDLDIAIDTRIMMDLEALIFMMRMKEYLVK